MTCGAAAPNSLLKRVSAAGAFTVAAMLFVVAFALARLPATQRPKAPAFELVRSLDHPVISDKVGRDIYKINSGFEGGLYTKTPDGIYHLFPTECMSDIPHVAWDIHTMSHHWSVL